MQLSGRPLLPTRVDQPLYAARGTDDRALRAVRQGLNVLVLGGAGSGKTSFLHHLEYRLREEGVTAVYVDGRRTPEVDELLDSIRRAVGVEAPRMNSLVGIATSTTGQPPPPPAAEVTLDHMLQLLPPDDRVVILIDSPDRAAAHALFGQLRDTVWQLPVTWVVAADPSVESELRRPPADAFFDIVERLDPMNADEARDLLQRRGLSTRQVRSVIPSSDDAPTHDLTPRAVLDLARRLAVENATPQDVHRREADFQTKLAGLTRAAAMLVSEMRGQGAVSASDEALQRRMGWTRPRLTQVLKQLESEGLVRAIESSDGRTGRPRRLYEVVEP